MFAQGLSRYGSSVSVCDINLNIHSHADLYILSALGTPLEWPEAKQNAQIVREWGIEVWNRLDVWLETALILFDIATTSNMESCERKRARRPTMG